MGSRLEAVREAERSEVRFLNEIIGLGRVATQIHREVVERVQMLQCLALELEVGHRQSSDQRAGYPPGRTVCSSDNSASRSRTVVYSVGCSKSGATSASGRSTNARSASSKWGTCRSSGPLMTSSP